MYINNYIIYNKINNMNICFKLFNTFVFGMENNYIKNKLNVFNKLMRYIFSIST